MDDFNLIEKEWEMVREYQKKQNQNIPLYFFEKYSENICNIVFYKINTKFSSIPLERDDLISFVWKGIKYTLDNIKIDKNTNLVGCFVKQSYFNSLKEALRFLTNGHIILNNASSIDELKNNNINFKNKNIVTYQGINYKVLRDELIREITLKLHKQDQKVIQRIIYFKSLGYSLREISLKIKLPIYKIKNLYKLIVKIGKMIYKN